MLLAAEKLSKGFGGILALQPFSFALDRGVTAVIGPNGAGKTTLFNLLSGIYAPSGGRVLWRGGDITGLGVARRAGLGIQRTFQNLQIFFSMSAIENVMVGATRQLRLGLFPSLLNLPAIRRETEAAREDAVRLLRLMRLDAFLDARADAMPYGALKRLEIARSLAAKPRLLLLDEPAAGLNPSETEEIAELVRAIAEGGTAVLLVEHDMRLVMALADRIMVLDQGHEIARGSAAEIRANPEVIRAYLGAETP
jgi:branched-chain amino acid transport system ATP-binding protein